MLFSVPVVFFCGCWTLKHLGSYSGHISSETIFSNGTGTGTVTAGTGTDAVGVTHALSGFAAFGSTHTWPLLHSMCVHAGSSWRNRNPVCNGQSLFPSCVSEHHPQAPLSSASPVFSNAHQRSSTCPRHDWQGVEQ